MNALNNPQAQTNKQNDSFQQWLDRSIKASERMATDEKFRQEVAAKATSRSTPAEIKALIEKHKALLAQA